MKNQVKPQPTLGVIGGSGVYQIDGLEIINEHNLLTPYGLPSDAILEGRIDNRSVFFLPRHGKGHRFLPSEVPYCANIYALKMLGVTHLLAVSAVGIMQEAIKPGDMVVPDQIFDRTKGLRPDTFFGKGIVGHVSFAEPFCSSFSELVVQEASKHATVHNGGTYVCIEGPRFSSKAESYYYRETLKPAVIGMTAIPEAILAREAELSYAMLAMGTDYDCWHTEEEAVTTEAVLAVLHQNSHKAKRIVHSIAKAMDEVKDCPFFGKMKRAILTSPEAISQETKNRLSALYGQHWQ